MSDFVHEFPLRTTILPTMRLAGQYISATDAPAAFQVEFSKILEWLENSLPLPTTTSTTTGGGTTMTVPPGKWCVGIAVQSATTQTINIGSVPSGNQYGDQVPISGGTITTVAVLIYGGTTGSQVYFSGLTGVATISILTV